MAQKEFHREYTNREVYELLCELDRGRSPGAEALQMLETREELLLSNKRIEYIPRSIGRMKGLKRLDLSDNRYPQLPESLWSLSGLEELNLRGAQLSTLPEEIGRLRALRRLDLQYAPITALPESIAALTSLQELTLSHTNLTALPACIGALVSLRRLDLRNTGLTSLPEQIGALRALEALDLHSTKLSALPEQIGALGALQSLDLRGTALTELPEKLGQLRALRTLSLSSCPLTALPASLGGLTGLRRLMLNYTGLEALPEWIGQLPELENLYLGRNRFRSLPEEIGALPKLKILDLRGLTLDRIPRSLALRGLPFTDAEFIDVNKPGVYVRGLSLREQKLSVFLETPELIPGLYGGETAALRECKVILLGDGGTGKSYTLRRFHNQGRKGSYPTEETHGVEITDYRVRRGADSFCIHFWDFGGQEILHSMHRCFLTEETCYVVTVRTRDTDNTPRARYWLRTVQSFAPKSDVLLYVNLWGNTPEERGVDETLLRAEFPQIKGVIYCSAKEAEEEQFRARVMEPVTALAEGSCGAGKELSADWDRLLRRLKAAQQSAIREHSRNFLTREQYHSLCRECGVGDENASGLLTLFNNLGVCFSYHRDEETEGKPELPDYKLLNPIWLTNALYAIVEEGAAYAQEGVITEESVRAMLHNRAPDWVRNKQYRRTAADLVYGDEECRYVLDVAEHFRLCYRISADRLFFPALCRANSPAESLRPPEGFPVRGEYRFAYEYLPDSVIHKLMIGCLQKGYQIRRCWLKGMELGRLEHHRAVLRIAEGETLRLELYGREDHPLYELLPMLREEILRVNAELNLRAKELIAAGPDVFPVAQLLNTHKIGQELIIGSSSNEPRPVLELLERFFDAWTIGNMQAGPEGIRIGRYCYHRADKNDAVFRTALLDAYGEKCEYCGRHLEPFEMQVDHILAVHRKQSEDSHLRLYLRELMNRGFDLEQPDYVENFFPSCGRCNRAKSNDARDAVTLREYHAIALNHTPKVLRLMQKKR